MRRAAWLFSLCLLGLVVSFALLGMSQVARMPTAAIAVGSGSVADVPVNFIDHDPHELDASVPIPPYIAAAESNTTRRDRAMVQPLVELSLQSEPTSPGATLVAERLTYIPGATLAVRRYTQVRVVSLEAGTLEVRIDGVAFRDRRWPTGSLLTKEPHRVEGLLNLHPGDLLAVPAETAFTASNRGELPAVSLEVSVQRPLPLTSLTDRTGGMAEAGDVRHERLAAAIVTAPGEPAEVVLERLNLVPGRSLAIKAPAGSELFVVEGGVFGVSGDELKIEGQPGVAYLLPTGEHVTIGSNVEQPFVAVWAKKLPSRFNASG